MVTNEAEARELWSQIGNGLFELVLKALSRNKIKNEIRRIQGSFRIIVTFARSPQDRDEKVRSTPPELTALVSLLYEAIGKMAEEITPINLLDAQMREQRMVPYLNYMIVCREISIGDAIYGGQLKRRRGFSEKKFLRDLRISNESADAGSAS